MTKTNDVQNLLDEMEMDDAIDESNEPIDEVQELVWALIDDQATDTQIKRLEELLLADEEARRTYVMCMQMHADLHFLLGGKRPALPMPWEKPGPAEIPWTGVDQGKQKIDTRTRKPLPVVEMRPMSPTISISELFS
jgi:hypothetical protein